MEPYLRPADTHPVLIGSIAGGATPDAHRRSEDLPQRDDRPDLPYGSSHRLAGESALGGELRVA